MCGPRVRAESGRVGGWLAAGWPMCNHCQCVPGSGGNGGTTDRLDSAWILLGVMMWEPSGWLSKERRLRYWGAGGGGRQAQMCHPSAVL